MPKSHPSPSLFAFRFLFLFVFVCSSSPSHAGSQERTEGAAKVKQETTDIEDFDTLTGLFLGRHNFLDDTYDKLQEWKKTHHFPLSIGGNHWWHVDRDDRVYGNGYGVANQRGTYYYYAAFDPSYTFGKDDAVREVGAHFQGRFRDQGDKLRRFYKDVIWSYEAYAYADTAFGKFKGGQITLNFGYFWDNSWWEGIPYFDGYRFNPAYGFAWEKTWKLNDTITLETDAQYFIADDRVSGALAGADGESSLAGEKNTFVLRIAPTWKPNADTKVTLGASVLTREIAEPDRFGPGVLDDRQTAWAVDAAATYKKFTVFSQYTDSYGAASPARYVSGGPSTRQNSVEVGTLYKLGPFSPHLNYSYGWDHNPGGHQFMINPGVAINVSKSLTIFTVYVKWNVTNRDRVKSIFDDGFELIAVWNL